MFLVDVLVRLEALLFLDRTTSASPPRDLSRSVSLVHKALTFAKELTSKCDGVTRIAGWLWVDAEVRVPVIACSRFPKCFNKDPYKPHVLWTDESQESQISQGQPHENSPEA